MKTGKIEPPTDDMPILKAVMSLDIDKDLLYYLYTNADVMLQARKNIIIPKERLGQIPGLENAEELTDITEFDRIFEFQHIHEWKINSSLDNETVGIIRLQHEKFLSIKRGYQIKSIENSIKRLRELNE